MSIEKEPFNVGNFFRKESNPPEGKNPTDESWMEKIHIQGSGTPCIKGKAIEGHSPASLIAFNLLFPEPTDKELHEVQNMPESTLIEKMIKERAFRKLVCSRFEMHEVIHDSHCGLRAVIHAMNPDMDENSQKITAIILRGDLIEFIRSHHQDYSWISDKDTLEDYCSLISKTEMPIGSQEIEIMSDLLKTPIHVFCYKDAHISEAGELIPGQHRMLGKRYNNNEPVPLYFNPLENRYFPLKKVS